MGFRVCCVLCVWLMYAFRNVNKVHSDSLCSVTLLYSILARLQPCTQLTVHASTSNLTHAIIHSCSEQRRKQGFVFVFAFGCFCCMHFSNCCPSGSASPKVHRTVDQGLELGNQRLIRPYQISILGEPLSVVATQCGNTDQTTNFASLFFVINCLCAKLGVELVD